MAAGHVSKHSPMHLGPGHGKVAKCFSTRDSLIMLQLLVRWRWVRAGVVHTFWHAVGQWGYICCGKGSCVFVAGQDYHAWCSW